MGTLKRIVKAWGSYCWACSWKARTFMGVAMVHIGLMVGFWAVLFGVATCFGG